MQTLFCEISTQLQVLEYLELILHEMKNMGFHKKGFFKSNVVKQSKFVPNMYSNMSSIRNSIN